MRSCCVPFCSSTRAKSKKISFHEIPSNLELRGAWLMVILRRGDTPGSLWQPSDNSVVCSKHFSDADFKQTTKHRCLVPNAIPSIFPNYPDYALPKSSNKRKSPTSRNEAPPVKEKCVKERHFETSEASVNHFDQNGDVQCRTQNENNLKSSDAVRPSPFSSKKRKTPTPRKSKSTVKKKCVKEKHFETSVTESEIDAEEFEQNGDIQSKDAYNLDSAKLKAVVFKLLEEIEELKAENSRLRNKIEILTAKNS